MVRQQPCAGRASYLHNLKHRRQDRDTISSFVGDYGQKKATTYTLRVIYGMSHRNRSASTGKLARINTYA